MLVSKTETELSRSNVRCVDTHRTERSNSLWLPARVNGAAQRLSSRAEAERLWLCAGWHERDAPMSAMLSSASTSVSA